MLTILVKLPWSEASDVTEFDQTKQEGTETMAVAKPKDRRKGRLTAFVESVPVSSGSFLESCESDVREELIELVRQFMDGKSRFRHQSDLRKALNDSGLLPRTFNKNHFASIREKIKEGLL